MLSLSLVLALVTMLESQGDILKCVRRDANELLIAAELKRQMRVRHRLSAGCLGALHLSPRVLLYEYGTDENLLTVTTLTRAAFDKLLVGLCPTTVFTALIVKAEDLLNYSITIKSSGSSCITTRDRWQRMAAWVETREPLLKNALGYVDGKCDEVLANSRPGPIDFKLDWLDLETELCGGQDAATSDPRSEI
ncbi:hypothetical protein ON010_g12961 [Phytophthora cinnamomi]|nr:hypothetical protein ON010_g12961 [Phytophthora cinnamomi]